jgi:NADH:quinone reductase (non-electrogenic)
MTYVEKKDSYKKETALTQPRVVIVGGGFGGLYAARALAGAPVRVTLIDKRNYHLFRPLLYQAATGLLSADEISGPLRSILSRHDCETEAQAPTGEMAVTPPSIKKSAPTTYAESSDAR